MAASGRYLRKCKICLYYAHPAYYNMASQSSNPTTCRVLHLVHWLNRGGIEIWLLEMMRQTPSCVLAMDICCKGPHLGELAQDFRQAGTALHHLPQKRALWRSIRSLRDLLIRQRYDVLHVHTGVHSGWAVHAAKLAGVPVVTTFHNTRYPRESTWTSRFLIGKAVKQYARWSLRYATQKSQVATAVSQGVADVVQQISNQEDSVCDVVYLGVADPTILSPPERAQKRRELSLSTKEKVILHVGSMTEQKNHLGVLEIFRKVLATTPNVQLLLAGAGPLQKVIQERVHELNLKSKIQLLGLRTDIPELMQASDLLLFPSRNEGLSLTIMEASAACLPIVASNIPGNAEATANGNSAVLHAVDDHAAMADSVHQLIQDRGRRSELTSKARRIYEKNFSIEVSANKWRQLYEQVAVTRARNMPGLATVSRPDQAA